MTRLMRYSPGIGSLRRDFERFFEELGNVTTEEDGTSVWAPRADISETEDKYFIRLDTPGLSRDNIDVQLHQDVLSVSGERKSEIEDTKENYHRIERSYGRFFRSFNLPQAGNGEAVSASLQDGVLTIEVPKREESKPRKIQVS